MAKVQTGRGCFLLVEWLLNIAVAGASWGR